MRIGSKLSAPLLAIIVGIAMIVSAGLIVSNVAERSNHVIPKPIPVTVTLQDTDEIPLALGGDHVNWTAGDAYLFEVYDGKVYLYANASATDVSIVVEFSKLGINATDVVLQWTDGVNAWTTVAWEDRGNSLAGTIGAIGVDYPVGDSARYYFVLTYMIPGDYTGRFWAEAV